MYLNEQKGALSENGQAGALTEIEITSEMIEAGARRLCALDGDAGWTDGWLTLPSARQVVREVLHAALGRN